MQEHTLDKRPGKPGLHTQFGAAGNRKPPDGIGKEQEQGKGDKALDELMQEMDKIETDLVNKRLTNEMLKRQQDILTRLLEAERAEREQEQDEERQAQTAKQQPAKMPPALEEYLKKRRSEVDLFRTVSPALKPYYKQLVEEYIKGAGSK